jgi:probable phosphoglycerate mutase
MPTLLLIRHGENDYVVQGRLPGRLPGVQLNAHGRQQAAALAQALKDAPFQAIYTSPLERCQETAAPLAAALGLPALPRPGLLEIDCGEWQNCTLKELRRRKLWQAIQNNPARVRFPGGETFAEAQMRIVQELEALGQQHRPQDLIACFSHSDPIKLALSFYLGQPLDLFQRIVIATASISVLRLSEHSAQILHVNHNAAGFALPPQKPESRQKSGK